MSEQLNKTFKQVGTDINRLNTVVDILEPTKLSNHLAHLLSVGENVSKLLQEQLKFTLEQQNEKLRIALEKGVFYLEECLPNELREKVLSGYFKDHKASNEEALEVSKSLTKFFKDVPDGSYITGRSGSVFPITKYKGYLPEKFGADNRRIKRGLLTLTIDGAQPCVYIENKDNLHIDFSNVTFIAEEMGVSLFEVSNCHRWNIVHGGLIRTRGFLDVGYVGGLRGLFPPIDGWREDVPHLGTGYADKGYPNMGFNTTSLTHDLSSYRNNQAHVHEIEDLSSLVGERLNRDQVEAYVEAKHTKRTWGIGGYWTEDGEGHAFPQDDGTTSPKWGKWRGAQHGSHGNGWHFYGCSGFIIHYFDVQGLNGSAVVFGSYGLQDGTNVESGDSILALEKGLCCQDMKILGGYIHGNYVGGVGIVRGENIIISGINCLTGRVGHPDASIEHTRGDGTPTIDPGYWLWTSRYLPMNNIRYENNHFGLATRKICDAHTGNNVNIINNTGSCLYYACGLVIQEAYSAVGGGGDNNNNKAEHTSFRFHDSNINIIGNTFYSACIGLHLNNGSFGVGTRKSANLWWLRGNVRVLNNNIYANRGLSYNYGHSGFHIEGNTVTFAMSHGEPFGTRCIDSVRVTNGGSGYSNQTYIRVTGGGNEAYGYHLRPVIQNGVLTAVTVKSGGTKVHDLSTLKIEIIDPTGTGSGAETSVILGNRTYAYYFGSLARYGTITDATFSFNRAKNSPDGNFGCFLWTDKIQGGTIEGNRIDTTPYTVAASPAEENRPYKSTKTDMFNPGFRSQVLKQASPMNDCFIFNNKNFNLQTGIVEDIVFRQDNTSSGTKAEVTPATVQQLNSITIPNVSSALTGYVSKSELDSILSAKIAEAIKGLQVTQPSGDKEAEVPPSPPADSGPKENPSDTSSDTPTDTQTSPDPVPAQPTPTDSKFISFDLSKMTYPNPLMSSNGVTSLEWILKGNAPSAPEALVETIPGHNEYSLVRSRKNPNRSDGVYLHLKNIQLTEKAEGNVTIAIPFRLDEFNYANYGWIQTFVEQSKGWDNRTAINPGFTTTPVMVDGVRDLTKAVSNRVHQVDGVNTVANVTQFELGKWYVYTWTGKMPSNDIILGSHATGNGVSSVSFSDHLRIYQDGTPSKEELDKYIQDTLAILNPKLAEY